MYMVSKLDKFESIFYKLGFVVDTVYLAPISACGLFFFCLEKGLTDIFQDL